MTRTLITVLLSSLVLTFSGYYFYQWGIECLPQNNQGTSFIITSQNSLFNNALTLGVSLGIIPIVLYLLFAFTKTNEFKRRLIVTIIITFCTVVWVTVWWYMMRSALNEQEGLVGGIPLVIDISSLNIGRHILSGILSGTILAYIFLHFSKPKNRVK